MPLSPASHPPRLLSRPSLAIIVAGGLLASCWLLASQHEAKLAMVTDGPSARPTPCDLLRSAFKSPPSQPYDAAAHASALAAISDVTIIPPLAAYAIILPASSQLADEQRIELLATIARNAFAVRQPALAAEVLLHACGSKKAAWPLVCEMLIACRAANEQREAVKTARAWLADQTKRLPGEIARDAFDTACALAAEAGLHRDAFELRLDQLKAQPAISASCCGILEQARRSAKLAGRTDELLPWIESVIAALPAAKLSLSELWQAAARQPASVAEYRHWVRHAAEIADWQQLSEKALWGYERQLAMGDAEALDRFMVLADSLGRGEDIAAMLSMIGHSSGDTGQVFLKAARLLAANGRAPQAKQMYQSWLAGNPADRTAAWELACLGEDSTKPSAALLAFEEFLRLFPDDPAGLKKTAALRIAAGQPQSALRDLDRLRDGEFDAATLDQFARLAESLGRDDLLHRALSIQTKAAGGSPDAFLRLADLARHAGESPVPMLRDGIAKFPSDPLLRVQLAADLLADGEHEAALTESLHPVLAGRDDALAIAFAAAVHTSRSPEVVAAAGAGYEKKSGLLIAARLDFAVNCILAGDTARGEAIFASISEDRSHLPRLAAARMKLKQFAEAERLAKLNVSSTQAPVAADWITLGDAASGQGKALEAETAYRNALKTTANRLAREREKPPVASSAPSRF